MAIQIPSREFPTLLSIASLPDADADGLIRGLRETQFRSTRAEYSSELAQAVPSIPKPMLSRILGTLFALYYLKESRNKPEELAAEINDAISASPTYRNQFDDSKKAKLKSRIVDLLSLDASPWALLYKASDVLSEEHRKFCDTRILSDLRPVFADSDESIKAAVVVHNLKISYHQDGDHKSFYVAMDDDDLKTLKKIIERAERKSVALKSMMGASNVRQLG